MHHLYGVNTYAAFNAGEVLTTARADELVGHKELPEGLSSAIRAGKSDDIRLALDQLEASPELFVFKTHAWPNELFGTEYRTILVIRDGRDALASYANYLVDIRFDSAALQERLRRMARSRSEFLNPHAWIHLAKILIVSSAKAVGLRRWMVSKRIDQVLQENSGSSSDWDWTAMNRSWLERARKPVIVYFHDLVNDPIGTVTRAVDALEIGLVPKSGGAVPSFAELKKRYPSFFRKGTSGDWRNHLSPAQEKLFRSKHDSMMKELKFSA